MGKLTRMGVCLLAGLLFGGPAVQAQTAAGNAGQLPSPPKFSDEERQQMEEQSTDKALEDTFSLKPEEVRRLKEMLDRNQKAAQAPVRKLEPRTRSVTISLEPGVEPEKIYLWQGYPTTLVFLDITGGAWPMVSQAPGNGAIKAEPLVKDSNMLTIWPTQAYAYGAMTVALQDKEVPITFEILPVPDKEKKVDQRVDVRVLDFGPNKKLPLNDSAAIPQAGDTVMQAFLDGLPPQGAIPLASDHARVQAWRYNAELYVRSTLSMLAPQGWNGQQSGAGGYTVFRMVEVPNLLMSDKGSVVNVTLTAPDRRRN